MKKRYARVFAGMWTGPYFRELSSEARLLLLYLKSNQHSNMVGLYELPEQYIGYDLRWGSETVTKRLNELLQKGFATLCQDHNYIYIPMVLADDPLQNENQNKGAIANLGDINCQCLFPLLYESLTKPLVKGSETLSKWLREQLGKPGYRVPGTEYRIPQKINLVQREKDTHHNQLLGNVDDLEPEIIRENGDSEQTKAEKPDDNPSSDLKKKIEKSDLELEKSGRCGVSSLLQLKKRYGAHVYLSALEYDSLRHKFNSETDTWIQKLDSWIEKKGTQYDSHYWVILKWSQKKQYDSKEEKVTDNKVFGNMMKGISRHGVKQYRFPEGRDGELMKHVVKLMGGLSALGSATEFDLPRLRKRFNELYIDEKEKQEHAK